MFVTFCLATVDLARGRIAYVRAGHVPPFVRRANGTVERLGMLGGLPLGMIEGAAYKAGETTFAPGDRILILTDGYTEAADLSGALFGEERIETRMAGIADDEAAFLAALTAEVRAFEAGQPASDDAAAILLWREPG
jgi:sigma-B regulation protein RsbU (phosphoserine phosphatase)